MDSMDLTRKILRSCMQLGSEVDDFTPATQLLGGFPEFNSLTITAIIASIEDELDSDIEDAEITGEIFETVGTLSAFIGEKLS